MPWRKSEYQAMLALGVCLLFLWLMPRDAEDAAREFHPTQRKPDVLKEHLQMLRRGNQLLEQDIAYAKRQEAKLEKSFTKAVEAYVKWEEEVEVMQWKSSQLPPKPNFASFSGGNGFLQMYNWRIGAYDHNTFLICQEQYGTVFGANRDGSTFMKTNVSLHEPQFIENRGVTDVEFGDTWVSFASLWRLGEMKDGALTLSHGSGDTAAVWHLDGTVAINEFHVSGLPNLWHPRQDLVPVEETLVRQTDAYIAFPNWRLGTFAADSFTFSAKTGMAATYIDVALRSPTVFGPLEGYTMWDRSS